MRAAVLKNVKNCQNYQRSNRKNLENLGGGRPYIPLKKVFDHKKILAKETETLENNYIYK